MTSPKAASPIASSKPLLVLASESPRRLALLAQAGIVPDAVRAAGIDETVHRNELPRPYAERLAAAKARAVAVGWNGAPGAVFLAADTVVSVGRRILPKAETEAQVGECLSLLSGRAHRVTTAVTVSGADGKLRTRTVETRLIFDRLDSSAIERYVRCGEGLGKAGGYAVQGCAEIFVRQLTGSYSNVVGLPLRETISALRAGGYPC